jgi:hypothetical protein
MYAAIRCCHNFFLNFCICGLLHHTERGLQPWQQLTTVAIQSLRTLQSIQEWSDFALHAAYHVCRVADRSSRSVHSSAQLYLEEYVISPRVSRSASRTAIREFFSQKAGKCWQQDLCVRLAGHVNTYNAEILQLQQTSSTGN